MDLVRNLSSCSCVPVRASKGVELELQSLRKTSGSPAPSTNLYEISAAAQGLRDACWQLFAAALLLLPTPQGLLGLTASSSVLFCAPDPKAAAARTVCVRALVFWQLVAAALTALLCIAGATTSCVQLWQQQLSGCSCGDSWLLPRSSASATAATACDNNPAGCDCRLCPSVSATAMLALGLLGLLLHVPLVLATRRVYARTHSLHSVGRGLLLL